MSDAYLEWLEIPPHLRPPTHYQLLGIDPSELDRDAITAAAQRQLDRLQPHQDGPAAEQCRRLAEEVVRARETLLDPVQRQRYDTLSPDAAEPWWKEPEPKPETPPSSPPIPGEEWWKEGLPISVAQDARPSPVAVEAATATTAPAETSWWADSPPAERTQPSSAAVTSEPAKVDWWKEPAPELEPSAPEKVHVLEPLPPEPVEPPVIVGPVMSVEPAPPPAPVVRLDDHRLPQATGGFPYVWVVAGVILLAAGGVGTAIMVKNGVFDESPKQVAQEKPKADPNLREEQDEPDPKPKPGAKKGVTDPESKVIVLDPDRKEQPPKKELPKKVIPDPKKELPTPEPKPDFARAATFRGHSEGSVYGIALSRDARFFLDVSDDQTIVNYSLGKREHSVLHKLQSPGVAVALCNDDRTAVFCDGGQVVVVDLDTRRQRANFVNPRGGIRSMAAAPDGSFVLTGSTDSCVRWWTVADGKLAHTLDMDEKAQVVAAAISSDGQSAAFGLSDGRVCAWDLVKRREVKRWKANTGPIRVLAFAPDGQQLVAGGEDGQVNVWQHSTGKLLTKLAGHKGAVLGAAWCADGKRILTGGIDRRVCLWDAAKAGAAEWSSEVSDKVFSLAVDPKGRFVLAGLSGGSVQLLPIPQGPGSKPEQLPPGTSES